MDQVFVKALDYVQAILILYKDINDIDVRDDTYSTQNKRDRPAKSEDVNIYLKA